LPETYPDITFDKNGVCNKCLEYDEKWGKRDLSKLQEEMVAIFNWAKRQGKKYDCAVPFSGGKDSTYTLYLCRKVYGLNVLAVNFKNGLQTEAAYKNMERTVRILDVGFASYGPPWNLMKKLYAHFLRTAGQFCWPCDMGIWATVYRIAEQEDVPLVVSGFSAQIESRGAKIYSYNNQFFKNVVGDLITRQEYKDFLAPTKFQAALSRLRHFRLTRYRRGINLPDYLDWDDKVIKETIEKEVGWNKWESTSKDHIDCLFAPVKNYLVVQKWGFGEKTTKYSAMLRAGQMTREEALERAQSEETQKEPEVIDTFMDILNITREEIMDAEKKSHLKYLG